MWEFIKLILVVFILTPINVTLCSGSRGSDGDVPEVDWHDADGLVVHWCYPGVAGDYLRSREVVS